MTAVIAEAEVARALPMPVAIAEVTRVMRAWHDGVGVAPRARLRSAGTTLHVLPGMVEDGQGRPWAGTKSYLARDKGLGHVVVLYPPHRTSAVVVEATLLGAIRTGAASAVATRAMHPAPSRLACVGAGLQAEYQIRALAALGGVGSVAVTSRTASASARLAGRLRAELGVEVDAVDSVDAAVDGADVVCTITRASRPVLTAGQLAAGAHVNAVGSNSLDRQEVDATLVRRSDVVVDSREQARYEAGDLLPLVDAGELAWESLVELGEVLAGGAGFRRRADFTLFESLGVGVLDIALAAVVAQNVDPHVDPREHP